MRCPSACFAAALLASCGPGAGDRPPIGKDEGEVDTGRSAIWANPARLGVMLSGDWQVEFPCAQPCVYESARAPPFAGMIYGTYGPNGDADTAAFAWSGMVPEGVSAIAIPTVGGPASTGVSVRVIADGQVRGVLQAPPPDWKAWRVHVKTPSASRRIRIEVTDRGRDFGQWIAIGTPYAVR